MTYSRFSRLLRLKLEMSRDLHTASGTDARTMRLAMHALSDRLNTDSDYSNNLRRYSTEAGQVG